MKILLISDIHGNKEALQAVLQDLSYDTINVLGDIVGYMTNPEECTHLIHKYDCIIGNHDYVVSVNSSLIKYFNPLAQKAILWTKDNISPETINFLKNLPFQKVYKKLNYTIAHGDITDQNFNYIEYNYQARNNFSIMETPILFIGHTHVPCIWEMKNLEWKPIQTTYFPPMNTKIYLNPNSKYIVNIGSVGQPRDKNSKSCCVIFDTDDYSIEYKRISYDIKTTIQKIKQYNLPSFLHERLIKGI